MGEVEEMMCVVCECYRGGIVVMDVICRRLCKYDLRKGDLFVLSCARMRRVRRGSVVVCAVFYYCLLWLETIDVCI